MLYNNNISRILQEIQNCNEVKGGPYKKCKFGCAHF